MLSRQGFHAPAIYKLCSNPPTQYTPSRAQPPKEAHEDAAQLGRWSTCGPPNQREANGVDHGIHQDRVTLEGCAGHLPAPHQLLLVAGGQQVAHLAHKKKEQ